MKAYQLTILVLALCQQQVSAAPRPQQIDNGPPALRYTSKYPQHPVNQGQGDNYPKYWLNEAWDPSRQKSPVNPTDYRASQGYTGDQLYRNPYAPVNDQQYNTQPRNLFVPYPYAETWDKQNTRVPALEKPDPEVPTFGTEATYQPPHGFPRERGAARAAIGHYSKLAAANDEESVDAAPPAPKPEIMKEPKEDDLAMFKNADGHKNLGLGSDFSGYTKEAKMTPVIVTPRDDGWSEVSYNHDDVRRQLSDIPVINEQESLVVAQEPRRRKNKALEKIEGFLGPDEAWHQKRSLHKRSEEDDEDLDEDDLEVDDDVGNDGDVEDANAAKVVVKGVNGNKKPESEWPEHIRNKAERMMKAAEVMQARGSKMLATEEDDTTKKQTTEDVEDEYEDAVEDSNIANADEEYEVEEEEMAPQPSVVARKRPARPAQKPVQPVDPMPDYMMPQTSPQTARWKAPEQPTTAAPKKAPKKKTPAPAPVVPGPNKKKNQRPTPAPAQEKEKEDPLMIGELPERSGKVKHPKKPKSARPSPQQESQPQRKKPVKSAKKSQQQDNLPNQSGIKKPRIQNVKRDEIVPPHLVDTMLSEGKMKKMGKMNNMRPQIKGSAQNPSQGSKGSAQNPIQGSKGASGGMKKTGRTRPSVNQDRPGKKKSQHSKREPSLGKRAAIPEADPDAQNRRVLPGGPPVTIRRVLGAGEPAPTARPAPVNHAVQNQAASGVYQIPDGQVQVGGGGAVAVQVVDGQVQFPAVVAPVPVVPQVVLPPQTITVNVPGPVQTVVKPQVVEKIVTQVQTIERPVHHTQLVHQTATVVKQVPVEHTVVQNVPVYHTQIQNVPVYHTQIQNVPVYHTQIQNVPVYHTQTQSVPVYHTQIQSVPVHHTVIQSVPVHHTVIQSIPYPVELYHTATVVSSVPFAVQHTVVEKVPYPVQTTVAIPVKHTVVEKVPYAVETTVVQSVPVPVRHTVVQSVPVEVKQTATATAIVSYPVRITITPEAITKIVSAPTVTQMATTIQTAVEYETIVEQATKVVERVAIPSSSPVAIKKEIHGHKDIVSTIETCKNVPVTKTICVCPSCDQTEEHCGCGTFDNCVGPECSAAHCTVMTELECIPRTPKEIEEFVRSHLPSEFA
ncbi:hypothetical protein EX30DRAFT_252843 [Ascodesmis nigricans]|uniref:Membrane anchor Opy2 N-terminal domain-containing protein n=1 Tax=Ascodesmis nigricans TaxID=341454 RepID=A0A4V3SIX5_9PEZI|nr:hypothetical protein EX30DRAFT_252843 [Ascodesmis nigricans]